MHSMMTSFQIEEADQKHIYGSSSDQAALNRLMAICIMNFATNYFRIPVAVPSCVRTSTVYSKDAGLSAFRVSVTTPSPSLTLYCVGLKTTSTGSSSVMPAVAVSASPLVVPWEAAVAGMVRTAEKSSVSSAVVSSVMGMDTEAVVSPARKVAW